MATSLQDKPRTRRRATLPTRARIVVAGVLLIALALSAALIYFQPGTRTFTNTHSSASPAVSTDGPQYPPGTRYYYRRGQWVPLDQQEAPQP